MRCESGWLLRDRVNPVRLEIHDSSTRFFFLLLKVPDDFVQVVVEPFGVFVPDFSDFLYDRVGHFFQILHRFNRSISHAWLFLYFSLGASG